MSVLIIIALLCGFFVFGFLISLIPIVFIVLFLADVIALAVYASVRNKRMGNELSLKLEENGLRKIKQDFRKA